jgi:uncharacterized iron-regulated membrane protein
VTTFLRRPQSVLLRKALFQIHLWTGIAIGLYVLVVSVSGAALMFRIDMQRAIHSELFTPSRGETTDAATMLESVGAAFPNHRVSGIDAPTTARPTYLAYVANDEGFLTLLFDPVTATLLGELPPRSFVRTLQDLHFDLLAGRTGRIVNGVGGLLLLALGITGLVIWWPGIANWRRGFTVDFRRSWKRVNWDLHGAIGVWTLAMIAMWGVTGAYFAWPSQFRAAVNAMSPLTVSRAPSSGPASAARERVPTWRELIDAAERRLPDQHVARVIPPSSDKGAFLVTFSRVKPTPVGPADLTSVYLDRYTGAVLAVQQSAPKTAGDLVMVGISPLHVGNFGGLPIRIAWLGLGLAPAVLFVTGFIMWWTRVVRPRWLSWRRIDEEAAA